MNSRVIACSTALLLAVFTGVISASQVEVSGSSSSRVTDLLANPNAVNDAHMFDNVTPATVLTPTTTSSAVSFGSGNTSGWVTASMGVFHGYSNASYGNTGNNEYATTDVRASASDLVTVTSATLPMGTPVTRHFVMSVHGTLATLGVISGGAYETFAFATQNIYDNNHSANTLSLSYNSDTSTAVLSGTLNCFVGDQLTMGQSMELTTYVSGSYLFAHPDSSTVDFSNTIQFYSDSGTPGTSLVSVSGYDYSIVPEPSSMILLGLGCISLAGFRRYFKRSICRSSHP